MAAAKTDFTSSAKAAARKKSQQQKNQKANPPAKKKQPPQPVFEGITSGVSPMKDIVIAQGNGNIPGQFRIKTSTLDYNGERDLSSIINCVIFRL
jgi:hypothetical protein